MLQGRTPAARTYELPEVEKERSRSGVPDWLSRLSGAQAYSAYLRAIGRDASVVPVPDRGTPVQDEEPSSSVRDRHLVLLSRSPIHLVSLRTGVRDERGRIPLAYHYVVRTQGIDDGELFDARVGQSFRGFLTKTRTRLTFVGGALADRLRGDDDVRSALFTHLASEDDLVVAPDPTRGLVRIVHAHPVSPRRPLWVPHPTTFYERLLPEPLLHAIERIAAHVRALHRRTENRAQSRSA